MAKITELDMSKLEELKAKAKSGKITDEERREMMALMDEELEQFMLSADKRSGQNLDRWTEENWEEEMMKHPMFVTQDAIDKGEMSPVIQGLADLKYSVDDNTPLELAENYREDGNFNFKCKKYRYASLSYTEGLKHAISEKEDKIGADAMKAKLLNNRSASQFFIKNYRSALLDARLTLKVQPDHSKALFRAIQCCFHLKRYKEAVEFCDHGLLKISDLDASKSAELKESRSKAEKFLKEAERNARKEAMAKKKREKESKELTDLIRSRGIQIVTHKVDEDTMKETWDLDDLEPTHPAALNKRVHLTIPEDAPSTSLLVWPVLFLYPEFGETDFIQEFVENQRFQDHIDVMFGDPDNRPGWDAGPDIKYTPPQINMYFEDITNPGQPKMAKVNKSWTLTQALKDIRYRVVGGTPCFVLVVAGSKFEKEYLKKYYN